MIKHLNIVLAVSLFSIMGSAMALPQTSQCDQLINTASQNQSLTTDFYKSNLPLIKTCLNNCDSLYSGADISTCKSNLGSMEFNANLSVAVNKTSPKQKPQAQTSAPAPAQPTTTAAPTSPAATTPSSPLVHAKNPNDTAGMVSPNINTNTQVKTNNNNAIRWD